MHNPYYSLITGASQGFGKAMALECASRKMNLILVALPGPELYHLADFIKKNYKVDAIAIETDLTSEVNCKKVFKQVCELGLSVNMLINNAGIGGTQLFSERGVDFYQKQIKLNVAATVLLTRLFLEMLIKNKPSHILNVGSLCSHFSLPMKQVYGGTKSFIYFFSKSLRIELESDHVHVSVICPGGMNTNKFVTMGGKSCNWLARQSIMEPEAVATIAIRGLLKNRAVIIPGRMNKLFLLLNLVLPAPVKKLLTDSQMKKLSSAYAPKTKAKTIIIARKTKSLTA